MCKISVMICMASTMMKNELFTKINGVGPWAQVYYDRIAIITI